MGLLKAGAVVHAEQTGGRYHVASVATSAQYVDRLAELLNEQAAQGWRLVRTDQGAPGTLLVIFERDAVNPAG